MRHLVETHPIEQIELIDGVKIKHPQLFDHWILVLPDADEPLFHLMGNGENQAWVTQALQDCRDRIQTFEALENAINNAAQDSAVI